MVTGSAVRLTGSGLGCEDWPSCTRDRFVADLEFHAMMEFTNRLFTGVVAAAVIAAVAGAWFRRPRRHDLTLLSLGLVAGVLAQIVLGALLVWSHLDPRFTMGHFLLSMVLLWNAALLDCRARSREPGDAGSNAGSGPGSATDGGHQHPDARRFESRTGPGSAIDGGHQHPDRQQHPDGLTRLMLWGVLVVTAVLLVSGTLVTGAGPHAGDTRAERLPLLVREVARVHSLIAIALLALVMVAWWRLRNAGNSGHTSLARVAGLLTAQGIVGYTQYFMGVPALLVGVHVALAAVTWIEVVRAVHGAATVSRHPRPPLHDEGLRRPVMAPS